jgi:hypothetical protein
MADADLTKDREALINWLNEQTENHEASVCRDAPVVQEHIKQLKRWVSLVKADHRQGQELMQSLAENQSAAPETESGPWAHLQNCPECDNDRLAILTTVYKDGRPTVYCDCCGLQVQAKTWNRVGPSRRVLFERWCKSENLSIATLRSPPYEPHTYADSRTHSSWIGFNAALDLKEHK